MVATRQDIKHWLARADKTKHSHMVVATDTFDWEDYPIYVLRSEDASKVVESKRQQEMTQVTEVYNLDMDLEAQLSAFRVFNI